MASESNETILVTGAAGFIGFHLTARLLNGGRVVVGADNLNAYYDVALKEARLARLRENARFRFVKTDLADAAATERLFESVRPSIVVHLAAQAGVRYSIDNPRAYVDSNLVGFFNVLEACRRFPVKRLLYASSSSVYGNQKKTPFSTSDPTDRPVSFYAATKKANELAARSYSALYGIPTTGLRFFTVYGPFGRPDMAYFKFARKIVAGEPIQLYNGGDMRRDFTYVDDVVASLEKALDVSPPPDDEGVRHKIYNVGANRPVRLGYFVETLEKLLGRTAVKEFLPMQPGDVRDTFADVDDLVRDFQYAPTTPLETGLARFVDWFRTFYTTDR